MKNENQLNIKKCPICGNNILVPAWKYCSDKCNCKAEALYAKKYAKKFREKNPNYIKEWRKKHPGYFKSWKQNRKNLRKKFMSSKIDKGLLLD